MKRTSSIIAPHARRPVGRLDFSRSKIKNSSPSPSNILNFEALHCKEQPVKMTSAIQDTLVPNEVILLKERASTNRPCMNRPGFNKADPANLSLV